MCLHSGSHGHDLFISIVLFNTVGKMCANFVIEDICGSKIEGGRVYYLVKWDGYESTYKSWVEEHNVNANIFIDHFW